MTERSHDYRDTYPVALDTVPGRFEPNRVATGGQGQAASARIGLVLAVVAVAVLALVNLLRH